MKPDRIGSAGELTASPLLRRNMMLNLVGQGLPLIVAVVAIPPLIEGIGVDRFGLLALAWLVIGYFSLFDLGIGRALTQLVSERIGQGREAEVAGIAWTGLFVMTAVGLAAWGVLYAVAPLFVTRLLNVAPELEAEAIGALRLLALAIPFVVSAAGLRGLLEAAQRFGYVNVVRIPMGTLMFLGPLVVLPFSSDLRPVVGALAIARVVGWAGYALLLLRAFPSLGSPTSMDPGRVGALLRFGGWITVSNIVSPLMVHLDRVVIGAVLSMAAVAYYATPFEVVTRLWIVPAAVVGVLFPAFAVSFSADYERAARLFERATSALLLVLGPIVMLVVGLAGPALAFWVGSDFAREGTAVAQWLALGVFVNSLAQVPYALLQAAGRPDLTAKLHLIEAPIYFLMLWQLLTSYGLAGAAMAWTLRVAIDGVLLFVLATRILPSCRAGVIRLALRTGPAIVCVSAAALPVSGVLSRAALLGGLLIVFVATGWLKVLDASQRVSVLARLRSVRFTVALAALGFIAASAAPLRAQEAEPRREVSSMGLRGEEASYLRALQLTGRLPLHPWGIRGFGPHERAVLTPSSESAHPWRSRIGGRILHAGEKSRIRLDAVEVDGYYQSAFPLNWQTGPMWTGRGLAGALRVGGEARFGPVTLRVAPTLWGAQNDAFPIMQHSRIDKLPYADPRRPQNIDFPQRFGDGAVGGLDGGESELRLDGLGLGIGVSTSAIGWGPGEVFSLVMSGRGIGFPHAFVGTSRPLDLRLFELQIRGAWGELAQSDYAPWEGLQARRFASSLVFSLMPAPFPGLEIGLGRFFHVPWREGGPRLADVLRPIETIIKKNRFIDDPEIARNGPGIESRDNQLATVWARWVFPHAGLELYGEFARNDHPWDSRDLLVEPDQNSAWMLGGAWSSGGERMWVVRGETANARITHIRVVRQPQDMFYQHSTARQGHTHAGHILGTPAVYGGGGSYFGVDRYEPWGRLGARWRRELRNDGYTPPGGFEDPTSAHDVIHALSVDGVWFRRGVQWSAELTGAYNLNRYFQDDVFNVRLVVGAKARF